MSYDPKDYEYYKICGQCGSDVLPCIILVDEDGRERCPYCGGHELGPLKRNLFCSVEVYMRCMEEEGIAGVD